MKSHSRTIRSAVFGLASVAGGLIFQSAMAASASEAQAQFRAEQAACLNGTSQQDRATCLQEARAALAEARRGRLDTGEDARTRERNALQRCTVQPPADREECERMARGEGKVSGSVGAGGVIRELTTRVDGPPTGTGKPAN